MVYKFMYSDYPNEWQKQLHLKSLHWIFWFTSS